MGVRRRGPLNLVHVDGTLEAAIAVRNMPDVTIREGGQLEDGRTRISGYVPTEAFPAIEALGATITVVKDEAALEAQDAELYALLDDGGGTPPVV